MSQIGVEFDELLATFGNSPILSFVSPKYKIACNPGLSVQGHILTFFSDWICEILKTHSLEVINSNDVIWIDESKVKINNSDFSDYIDKTLKPQLLSDYGIHAPVDNFEIVLLGFSIFKARNICDNQNNVSTFVPICFTKSISEKLCAHVSIQIPSSYTGGEVSCQQSVVNNHASTDSSAEINNSTKTICLDKVSEPQSEWMSIGYSYLSTYDVIQKPLTSGCLARLEYGLCAKSADAMFTQIDWTQKMHSMLQNIGCSFDSYQGVIPTVGIMFPTLLKSSSSLNQNTSFTGINKLLLEEIKKLNLALPINQQCCIKCSVVEIHSTYGPLKNYLVTNLPQASQYFLINDQIFTFDIKEWREVNPLTSDTNTEYNRICTIYGMSNDPVHYGLDFSSIIMNSQNKFIDQNALSVQDIKVGEKRKLNADTELSPSINNENIDTTDNKNMDIDIELQKNSKESSNLFASQAFDCSKEISDAAASYFKSPICQRCGECRFSCRHNIESFWNSLKSDKIAQQQASSHSSSCNSSDSSQLQISTGSSNKNVLLFTKGLKKDELKRFYTQLNQKQTSYWPLITIWPVSADLQIIGLSAKLKHWLYMTKSCYNGITKFKIFISDLESLINTWFNYLMKENKGMKDNLYSDINVFCSTIRDVSCTSSEAEALIRGIFRLFISTIYKYLAIDQQMSFSSLKHDLSCMSTLMLSIECDTECMDVILSIWQSATPLSCKQIDHFSRLICSIHLEYFRSWRPFPMDNFFNLLNNESKRNNEGSLLKDVKGGLKDTIWSLIGYDGTEVLVLEFIQIVRAGANIKLSHMMEAIRLLHMHYFVRGISLDDTLEKYCRELLILLLEKTLLHYCDNDCNETVEIGQSGSSDTTSTFESESAVSTQQQSREKIVSMMHETASEQSSDKIVSKVHDTTSESESAVSTQQPSENIVSVVSETIPESESAVSTQQQSHDQIVSMVSETTSESESAVLTQQQPYEKIASMVSKTTSESKSAVSTQQQSPDKIVSMVHDTTFESESAVLSQQQPYEKIVSMVSKTTSESKSAVSTQRSPENSTSMALKSEENCDAMMVESTSGNCSSKEIEPITNKNTNKTTHMLTLQDKFKAMIDTKISLSTVLLSLFKYYINDWKDTQTIIKFDHFIDDCVTDLPLPHLLGVITALLKACDHKVTDPEMIPRYKKLMHRFVNLFSVQEKLPSILILDSSIIIGDEINFSKELNVSILGFFLCYCGYSPENNVNDTQVPVCEVTDPVLLCLDDNEIDPLTNLISDEARIKRRAIFDKFCNLVAQLSDDCIDSWYRILWPRSFNIDEKLPEYTLEKNSDKLPYMILARLFVTFTHLNRVRQSLESYVFIDSKTMTLQLTIPDNWKYDIGNYRLNDEVKSFLQNSNDKEKIIPCKGKVEARRICTETCQVMNPRYRNCFDIGIEGTGRHSHVVIHKKFASEEYYKASIALEEKNVTGLNKRIKAILEFTRKHMRPLPLLLGTNFSNFQNVTATNGDSDSDVISVMSMRYKF